MADCSFDQGMNMWQGGLIGFGIGGVAGFGIGAAPQAIGALGHGGTNVAVAGTAKAGTAKVFMAGLAKGVLVGTTTQMVSQQALTQLKTADNKPFMMDGGAVYKDSTGNKYIDQKGQLYKIDNSAPPPEALFDKYQQDLKESTQQ